MTFLSGRRGREPPSARRPAEGWGPSLALAATGLAALVTPWPGGERATGGAGRESPRRGILLLAILVLSVVAGTVYLLVADGGTGGTPQWNPNGSATGGPQEVTECTRITEPGRYLLVTDVESGADVCFEIRASDVVFDGGGHLVRGDLGQGSTAVAVGPSGAPAGPLRNVTVRDLVVENWVFGVVYDDVDEGAVDGVRTFHDIEAITIRDSTGVVVRGVEAREGCVGLDLVRSRDVRVADTSVRWFSIVGVSVVDTHGVAFSNVSVAHAEVGISLFRSTDVSYEEVTVTGTGDEPPQVDRSGAAGCALPCEDGPPGPDDVGTPGVRIATDPAEGDAAGCRTQSPNSVRTALVTPSRSGRW